LKIFGQKRQKMNGVSVSPGQNLQNAPTWQVEIYGKKRQKMNGVSVSPGQNLQNAPTWQVENIGKKRQKMNGVSVSPGQNLQNAPTWQVENTAGRRPFLRIFRPGFRSPCSLTPSHRRSKNSSISSFSVQI